MRLLLSLYWIERILRFLLFGACLLLPVVLAGLLIWAPHVKKTWLKTTFRILGAVVALALLGLSFPLTLGLLMALGDTTTLSKFPSPHGDHAALLVHGEQRDSASSVVFVKGDSCCRRFVAYEYFGDGDDDMTGDSVRWIDDRHLLITYTADRSGKQTCEQHVADVEVVCRLKPHL